MAMEVGKQCRLYYFSFSLVRRRDQDGLEKKVLESLTLAEASMQQTGGYGFAAVAECSHPETHRMKEERAS